jgi:hypothetical protein
MQEHGADYNLITNCTFTNLFNHAIYSDYIGGSYGSTNVTNCIFDNYLNANAAAWQVKTPNNKLWNCSVSDWYIGFSIYSESSGYQANGNEFYNISFLNVSQCFWVGKGNDAAITKDTYIHDNVMTDAYAGIALNYGFPSYNINNTQIYNNAFNNIVYPFRVSEDSPSLINNTSVWNNTFSIAIPATNIEFLYATENLLAWNNTGFTGTKTLALSVVGGGSTVPDGLGWQYLTATNATVTWTPYGGNSRIDFSIDDVNQTTTESPINITMGADHVGIAYFSGSPPPVIVTITNPTNTTYTISTVSVEISASGGTIDKIWWNCKNGTSWIYGTNQTYTAPTSMTGFVDGASYTFYAWANNTDGEWDEETVMFTVGIPPSSFSYGNYWGGWWLIGTGSGGGVMATLALFFKRIRSFVIKNKWPILVFFIVLLIAGAIIWFL